MTSRVPSPSNERGCYVALDFACPQVVQGFQVGREVEDQFKILAETGDFSALLVRARTECCDTAAASAVMLLRCSHGTAVERGYGSRGYVYFFRGGFLCRGSGSPARK